MLHEEKWKYNNLLIEEKLNIAWNIKELIKLFEAEQGKLLAGLTEEGKELFIE